MAHLRQATLLKLATLALSAIATLTFATRAAAAEKATAWERAVTGQWKLIAALDGAEIASLDEHEAAQLVGRVFTIRREAVRFGARTCGASDFEAERVSPRMYFPEQFHASAQKLGLPDPVTAVDLSCTTVFIKRRDRLVIFWEGWFFDAVHIER